MADAEVFGQVLWYELMTTDVKAAKSFYGAVVGWTAAPFDASSPQAYDVWKREGDVGVGGVMPIPSGMSFPPYWGMYVGTPKLDDTVAEIERRGGGALSPVIELPKVGRMRTMRDPQGAAFSLLEPEPAGHRHDVAPEVGDTSWHELYTTDAAAALAFYTQLFGWEAIEPMDMGEMGKYYMFGRGKALAGGMMNKPPAMAQVPPNWGLYFRVPDVHSAAERVKAHGGTVLNGPMEVPGGDWIVNCMDAQGAAFSLHHKKQG
jgi:uncharacterized protein